MSISFKALGTYGHMGNSLFQAACAIALAKRNGDLFVFPSSWKYKNSFNLPAVCFVNDIVNSFSYSERNFHYEPIKYRSGLDLLGYFQSELYFKDCEDYIRQVFKPKYEVEFRPGVASIHVRRTDYLNFPKHHPALGMDYYEEAMLLSGMNKFLVFSDDILWCKQHFIGNSFEFSEGFGPVEDLSIQSKCASNIIANSSFSWWAAWLNDNPDKMVIAPQKWFGPALSGHNTKDLIPSTWIKI